MALNNLPQISSPLPWHVREWECLQEQFSKGQLPHALLLVGGQYTGKSPCRGCYFALMLEALSIAAIVKPVS
jgi:hypothetical protein